MHGRYPDSSMVPVTVPASGQIVCAGASKRRTAIAFFADSVATSPAIFPGSSQPLGGGNGISVNGLVIGEGAFFTTEKTGSLVQGPWTAKGGVGNVVWVWTVEEVDETTFAASTAPQPRYQS